MHYSFAFPEVHKQCQKLMLSSFSPLPYVRIQIDRQSSLLSHIDHRNWVSTPGNTDFIRYMTMMENKKPSLKIWEPVLQHYILPQGLLLSNGFAEDHHLRVKHLGHAGRTLEMDCDHNPGKANYCSVVT